MLLVIKILEICGSSKSKRSNDPSYKKSIYSNKKENFVATSERIHLVLPPNLMKAFRDMADQGYRSNSSQFALLIEQEIARQRQVVSHRSATSAGNGEVSPPAQ